MSNAKSTRAAFAGLIEKPVLTDELLARPPFRFILDIVSSTVAKTGYLKDRFPSGALDPSKFREKADKIAFLDTIIEVLNDGSLPTIKSSKIVAGKEPELTNQLLIKLAEQARAFKEQKSEAKRSREPSATETKEKSRSREPSATETKEKSRSREPSATETKEKSRSREPSATETKEKSSKSTRHRSEIKEKRDDKTKKHKKSSKDDKTKPVEETSKTKSSKENGSEHRSRKRKTEEGKKAERKKSEPVEERKIDDDSSNRDINSNMVPKDQDPTIDEPSSAATEIAKDSIEVQPSTITDDSGVSDMTDMTESPRPVIHDRVPSARPHTSMNRPGTAASRPAPPKLKRKQIAVIETAPPPVPLIDETQQPEEHQEENFLVEDVEDIMPSQVGTADILASDDPRGGLVQKMIDTTTELKETNLNDAGDVDEVAFNREKVVMEAFSNSLQSVTRTTYPLSRIFDFAQEDLELMIKELEKWRSEAKKCENALKEKDAQGIGDAQMLSTVLASLDEDVKSMRTQVNATKSRINATDRRIQEMLNNL